MKKKIQINFSLTQRQSENIKKITLTGKKQIINTVSVLNQSHVLSAVHGEEQNTASVMKSKIFANEFRQNHEQIYFFYIFEKIELVQYMNIQN